MLFAQNLRSFCHKKHVFQFHDDVAFCFQDVVVSVHGLAAEFILILMK